MTSSAMRSPDTSDNAHVAVLTNIIPDDISSNKLLAVYSEISHAIVLAILLTLKRRRLRRLQSRLLTLKRRRLRQIGRRLLRCPRQAAMRLLRRLDHSRNVDRATLTLLDLFAHDCLRIPKAIARTSITDADAGSKQVFSAQQWSICGYWLSKSSQGNRM
jgi:hypothetical protein